MFLIKSNFRAFSNLNCRPVYNSVSNDVKFFETPCITTKLTCRFFYYKKPKLNRELLGNETSNQCFASRTYLTFQSFSPFIQHFNNANCSCYFYNFLLMINLTRLFLFGQRLFLLELAGALLLVGYVKPFCSFKREVKTNGFTSQPI